MAEDGFANHGAQNFGGNLHGAGRGEHGQCRKVGAGHSDHFCIGTAAADADPVILQQLDGDIAVGQQPDVVVKLAGRDGAGAFLLDLTAHEVRRLRSRSVAVRASLSSAASKR